MNKALAILGIAAALTMFGIGGSVTSSEVRLLYIVPSDKQEMPQMALGARNALRNALRHAQRWYQRQMPNGATFTISDEPMLVIHSTHPDDWFRKTPNGGDPQYYFLHNAIDEVGWKIRFSRDRFVILLDADVEGHHHAEAAAQRGGKFAGMPWRYALAYAGQNIEPPCTAVGVLAHELGHIFGLEHPAGCVGADGYRTRFSECDQIMQWGSRQYPRTSLSEANKSKLLNHSMFRRMELPASSDFDCDRLLAP